MEKRKQLTGIPSSLQSATDPDIDRLLSPAQYFSHPNEVLKSRILHRDEKRAILAAWVSDACAIESNPALRQRPGSPEPIPFDVIMEALQRLDAQPQPCVARLQGARDDKKHGVDMHV